MSTRKPTTRRSKTAAAEPTKLTPPASPTEAFQQTALRIRDVLRHPSVAIVGMDSMRTICLYLASRYLEKARTEALKIPDKFSWDEILNQARNVDGGVQFAFERFYNSNGDCLIDHLDRVFKTQKLSFDLRTPQKHCEILELLAPLELDKATLSTDILGWVYEQHLKTGSAHPRDLGQFFTDRDICCYMVELCRPAFKASGVPESVCDPAMGTGGFLAAWRRYYEEHFPNVVDWKVQQKEVFGDDTDARVAGVARLNMFLESRGAVFENLATRDSLHDDLARTGFDVILANMPFGLKGLKHADCCERIKALKIRGTKSEPLFLQLMMTSLNPGGRCAVVVPDGVLINSTALHVGTRKYLLEHFELSKIIGLRGKFFSNTSIQPSILFFVNTGAPTKSVEFCELEKGDDGALKETTIASVDLARIQEQQDLSLDPRRYGSERTQGIIEAACEMRPLEELCEAKNGKTLKSEEKVENGSYFVMGGGMDYVGRYSEHNREGLNVSISKSGASAGFVKLHEIKFWAGDCFTLKPKNDSVNLRFIYYCLKLSSAIPSRLTRGTTIPHCKWDDIKDVTLPKPPIEIQIQIVATLERLFPFGVPEVIDDVLKLTTRAMDLVLKEPSGALLEPIVATARLIRRNEELAEAVRGHMRDLTRSVNARSFERKKLSEVLEITTGKANTERTPEAKPGSDIPYFDSNGVIGYVAGPLFTGEYTITARKLSIGAVHNFSGAFQSSDNTINFTSRDTAVLLNRYFYFWLLSNNDVLTALSSGIKPGIRKSEVAELAAPVPPLDFQRELVARLDELQRQAEGLAAQAERCRADAKFMLDSYL